MNRRNYRTKTRSITAFGPAALGAVVLFLFSCGDVMTGLLDELDARTAEPSVVSLNKAKLELAAGMTFRLTAAVSPEGAALSWASSDAAVAAVDQEGLVTGAGIGTATITAAAADGGRAECAVTVPAEDGSEAAPFLIYKAEQLDAVRGGATGYAAWGPDKHYKLLADLSLAAYASGEGWVPIGNDTAPFAGSLDGNGHVITGLVINRTASYQGLFGYTAAGSSITDLGVENADVTGNPTSYSSVLAVRNAGAISRCYSSGAVRGFTLLYGLVAYNDGTISDSYARTALTGFDFVGGLVGENTGTISRCYAAGKIESNNASLGCGLVVFNSGTVSDSCYDSDVSGCTDTGKGSPKTTVEMKTRSTFAAWDFDAVWGLDPAVNDGYPHLKKPE